MKELVFDTKYCSWGIDTTFNNRVLKRELFAIIITIEENFFIGIFFRKIFGIVDDYDEMFTSAFVFVFRNNQFVTFIPQKGITNVRFCEKDSNTLFECGEDEIVIKKQEQRYESYVKRVDNGFDLKGYINFLLENLTYLYCITLL